MKLIAHRRNTIAELHATPRHFGVEVDIRSQGSELVIHHDPFVAGVSFREWFDAYNHGLLILNVKEEGLESALLAAMAERAKEDFFFLDQSFPFLIKMSRTGEKRAAVRVSEFESAETALALAGQVEWAWIDCFTQFPLTKAGATRLKAAGFKLCLVSPELHGRTGPDEIPAMQRILAEESIDIDAVCTKLPDKWAR